MSKPRVLFPYTEAGLGHIQPMISIADEFERRYGDRVECVRSHFFTEAGDKNLEIFERRLRGEVEKQNRSSAYGFFGTFNMEFWRIHLATWATMKFLKFGNREPGRRYMDELRPDLVFSTHWATNYYAVTCKTKPLTIMYCPDVEVNSLFSYTCDLVLVSNRSGYEHALKKHCKRFNADNLKQVPVLIRKEAYAYRGADKKEIRRKLGMDEDKFTVVISEGGYGIGKLEKICLEILKRDLPINLIAVCGRNAGLYEKFTALGYKGRTDFYPMGLVDNMPELLACADLACGKSGANSCAEACFFGLPMIITKYATSIEKHIGKYYIKQVGNAIKIFKPSAVAEKIAQFAADPSLMEPYIRATESQRNNYGAGECADEIFALLCKRFPELSK